jgi:putative sigma-54 modulation protein
MRVDITGRQVTITPAIRQLIARRLSKLERILNDRAISATIILTKEKYRHRAEIVIHARGDHMLRANGEGNAWNPSIADAASRLEQQAQKLKSKFTERKRTDSRKRTTEETPAGVPAEPAPRRIIRATRYAVKPMSVDDAALRVESGPDAFIVFRNADTDAVSIVYRRKDGNFGLIEPE